MCGVSETSAVCSTVDNLKSEQCNTLRMSSLSFGLSPLSSSSSSSPSPSPVGYFNLEHVAPGRGGYFHMFVYFILHWVDVWMGRGEKPKGQDKY